MSQIAYLAPIDWNIVKLVVFDVDGTLYSQRKLRILMARDLLFNAICKRDLDIISVLKTYRKLREILGDKEVSDFEPILLDETAKSLKIPIEKVQSIIFEWIELRPLPYLMDCMYPKLPQLFNGLRRSDKAIGILSDYPAIAKLNALGLVADFVMSASDQNVRIMKPNPRGLEALIKDAYVNIDETILIGDRIERDGLVARRLGIRVLIRSNSKINGWQTFRRYDDILFSSLYKD